MISNIASIQYSVSPLNTELYDESPRIKRWLMSVFLNMNKLQLKILSSYITHSNQTTFILNCFMKNKATSMSIISKRPEEPTLNHVNNSFLIWSDINPLSNHEVSY